MSIVTVQLGQCGNQIGGEFFNTLYKDIDTSQHNVNRKMDTAYKDGCLQTFFDQSQDGVHRARAVLVDMEQKVVAKTIAHATRSSGWRYSNEQQFSQSRGSGNNWAHGFCVHGPKYKSSIMNLVRKEVEKCDYFTGFMTLQSLAGGTGSGVGTYINTCLRDEYPHSFILNQVVWPYNMGEVIVQNYNAILTLSRLYQTSDSMILLKNDDLHDICTRLLALPVVSFEHINNVIAHQMACLLQPAYPGIVEGSTSSGLIRDRMGDLLTHMSSHPEYRLLTMRSLPITAERSKAFSSYNWTGLLKHLNQMMISNSPMEEGIDWSVRIGAYKFMSNLLILRGFETPAQTELQPFSNPSIYPSWLPSSECCKIWHHPRPLLGQEKTALLLSNGQSCVKPLDHVTGKAWRMFASRAYVHQYLKYNLTEEDFVDSFACLEQVISNYKHL